MKSLLTIPLLALEIWKLYVKIQTRLLTIVKHLESILIETCLKAESPYLSELTHQATASRKEIFRGIYFEAPLAFQFFYVSFFKLIRLEACKTVFTRTTGVISGLRHFLALDFRTILINVNCKLQDCVAAVARQDGYLSTSNVSDIASNLHLTGKLSAYFPANVFVIHKPIKTNIFIAAQQHNSISH